MKMRRTQTGYEKTCPKCKKEFFSLTESDMLFYFFKNTGKSDGLSAYCKPCQSVYFKGRYIPKEKKIKEEVIKRKIPAVIIEPVIQPKQRFCLESILKPGVPIYRR